MKEFANGCKCLKKTRQAWQFCALRFIIIIIIIISSSSSSIIMNRLFLPRSWCAGSRSFRDRLSPRQIKKLYLALLLPRPVNTRKDILYQNICASAIILAFLFISLHNIQSHFTLLLLHCNCYLPFLLYVTNLTVGRV
jgi:hypothetical protein